MEAHIEERVERWDSQPFSGGYDGLRDLVEAGFSGAVNAGRAWLFVLNGKIVGVHDGTIEGFEDASGTAYAAPDPALPLLFSMQERGGEQRAKYYTEDTPVSEADDKLSGGSFTGFLELSENVLSGDYYVVYYGDRSLPVAFVGNSERLLTGDEAFERADDEVGIYQVRNVGVDIVDIPSDEPDEPDDSDERAAATGAAGGAAAEAGNERADSTPESDDGPDIDEAEPTTDVGDTGAETTPSDGRDGVADSTAPDVAAGRDDTVADAQASGDGPDRTAETAGRPDRSTSGDRASGPSGGDPDGRRPEAERRTESRDRPDDGRERTRDRRSGDHREPAAREPAEDRTSDVGRSRDGRGDRTDRRRTDDRATDADAGAGGDGPAATNGSRPAPGRPERADRGRETTHVEEPERPADPVGTEETTGSTGAEAGLDQFTTGTPTPTEEDGTAPTGEADAESGDDKERRLKGEEQWRETRRIPSLNPDHSDDGGDRTDGPQGATSARAEPTGPEPRPGPAPQEAPGRERRDDPEPTTTSTDGVAVDDGATGDRVATLQDRLDDREATIDDLRDELAAVETERDRLQAERDDLDEENDRLRSRVTDLEATIDDLEATIDEREATIERLKAESDDGGEVATRSRQLTPSEALDGTNLFVQYDSKGKATLADAHGGEASRDDVDANLRIEHHTQFEEDDVAVDGQPFEAFLRETMEYRVAEWLITDLLYEIQETGHASGLRDLYDAIPRIGRVDLAGAVTVDGEEGHKFDVVFRDREMGDPLVVVNINDRRDPATQEMIVDLNEAATQVKETNPQLAAGLLVTASFFQPEVLETADQATQGGFLTRDSKESYVKLSRKQGYHLCLIESHDGGFNVKVPDL